MESSSDRKTHLAGWARVLLATGWLVVVVAAVHWGIGISSLSRLLGGGIIPIVFVFVLRAEVEASRKRGNIETDGPAAAFRKLSWLVAGLAGAGFVLLLQSLVRAIAEVAAR